MEYLKKDPSAAAHSGGVEMEKPPAASSAAEAKGSPLRKQIEVVGLRLTQNKAKKTEVRFVVVPTIGSARLVENVTMADIDAAISKL